MKIKITTDSSCDVSKDFLEKNNIPMIPLSVVLKDKEYTDVYEISPKDIFSFVEETKKLPKTTAVSIEAFKAFFQKESEGGYEIIHMGLGSPLSSTYNNSVVAVQELGLKNVHIIDCKSLSTGTTLMILYALDLVKQNKLSAEEIVNKIIARIPFIQASFVVDTLDYLYKGGRCSMLAMFGANILRLKPRLQLVEGKINSDGHYRGKLLPVYFKYIDDTLSKYSNPDKTRCFITHASADKELVDKVVEYVKSKNIFKEVIASVANGTVTSHCGKSTLGILYINDGGENI